MKSLTIQFTDKEYANMLQVFYAVNLGSSFLADDEKIRKVLYYVCGQLQSAGSKVINKGT